MASSVLDTVTLVGNVKIDDSQSPSYVAGEGDRNSRFTFSVAVTPRVKNDSTNKWEDGTTTWHNYVTAWGSLADNAHESLSNGDQVIVIGHETSHTYQNKEGVEKTSTSISVDYLGLSLRWASATSHREQGRNGGSGDSTPRGASKPKTAPVHAAPAPQAAATPADEKDNLFGDPDDLNNLFG